MPQKKVVTQEVFNRVHRLKYKNPRLSCRDIGAMLGMSGTTVWYVLQSASVETYHSWMGSRKKAGSGLKNLLKDVSPENVHYDPEPRPTGLQLIMDQLQAMDEKLLDIKQHIHAMEGVLATGLTPQEYALLRHEVAELKKDTNPGRKEPFFRFGKRQS